MAEETIGGRPIPEHGACFVCGKANPKGMGVTWYLQDDGRVLTRLRFTEAEQGPPGHAHGGASAAVLDEAMGAAVWAAGHTVLAVHLSVDYRRPVPLDVPVTVAARVVAKDGKAVHTEAELRLPDGTVAVQARGIYVEAPQMFDRETVRRWLNGGQVD